MLVKDGKIFEIIDKMKDHYNKNIYNRYIRKALLNIQIPQSAWDLLDSLSEKADFYKIQGYQFDELYDRILAAAQFIFHARKEVIPHMRTLLSAGTDTVFARGTGEPNTDRVLLEMAIKNFPVNLKIFSDMVNELYMQTTELDREMHKAGKPVYEKIPDLKQMGQYLVVEE